MPAIQTAPIQTDRRKFLAGTGAAFGALLASGVWLGAALFLR